MAIARYRNNQAFKIHAFLNLTMKHSATTFVPTAYAYNYRSRPQDVCIVVDVCQCESLIIFGGFMQRYEVKRMVCLSMKVKKKKLIVDLIIADSRAAC